MIRCKPYIGSNDLLDEIEAQEAVWREKQLDLIDDYQLERMQIETYEQKESI